MQTNVYVADEEKAKKRGGDSYNLIGQQMFGTADFKDAVLAWGPELLATS